jgi:UPF0716 protein FxsA
MLVALIEIAFFVLVAGWIGVGFAVVALLALSLLGAYLLKREGVRGWRRFRDAARQGAPPGPEAVNGLVGVVAALLLFVPGFITGILGLLLLVPPLRRFVAGRVRSGTEKRVDSRTAGDLFGPRQVRVQRPPKSPTTPPDGEVVEGEIVE